jgi:hypothetical protein
VVETEGVVVAVSVLDVVDEVVLLVVFVVSVSVSVSVVVVAVVGGSIVEVV